MAHQDAGHYQAKHPAGTTVPPELAEAVSNKATAGKIACATAHAIAEQFQVSPQQVGVALDLQEIRLGGCQMGLFGCGKGRKTIEAAPAVSEALREAIEAALTNGKLSCRATWQIAEDQGMERRSVAAACEALEVKISPCQLGAF